MSLVITGATGHLGRLVTEQLLEAGVPGGDIVATGRATSKIKDLADRGVRVRVADYADPASLRAAFDGASAILLVSGSEAGARLSLHRNAIEAARQAGAGLVAYTSIVNADATKMRIAEDHQATEAALRESGVPFVLLRNSWYVENYTDRLPVFLQYGAIYGSAGSGRVSAATRADFAAAAVAVLTTDGHAGRAYELGGDEPFTLAELAAEISVQAGQDVTYQDLPEAEYVKVLTGAGLPEPAAAILADADRGLARGDLYTGSGDLRRLIGRPATAPRDAIAAALSDMRG